MGQMMSEQYANKEIKQMKKTVLILIVLGYLVSNVFAGTGKFGGTISRSTETWCEEKVHNGTWGVTNPTGTYQVKITTSGEITTEAQDGITIDTNTFINGDLDMESNDISDVGVITATTGTLTNLTGIGSSAGDVMYYDGTEWIALSSGTAGQYLKAGTTPEWDTPAGAGDVTEAGDNTFTGENEFTSTTTFSGYIDSEQAIKGWVIFQGTGTVTMLDSYNVSSVGDTDVGNYTINWDIPFSTTRYCVFVLGTSNLNYIAYGQLVNQVQVLCRNEAGTYSDVDLVYVGAIGDR